MLQTYLVMRSRTIAQFKNINKNEISTFLISGEKTPKNVVKPKKTHAWKGNVLVLGGWGVGPICLFFLGRKMGDDANERHTRGRLSAGSPVQGSVPSGTPLCCLRACGDGDASPAWRAEVGSDVDSGDNYSKTSFIACGGGRESSAERGAKSRTGAVWAGIPLPRFYYECLKKIIIIINGGNK